MNELDDLKETTRKLCETLDQMHRNEMFYIDAIRDEIERMTWQIFKTTNELKEINAYIGA